MDEKLAQLIGKARDASPYTQEKLAEKVDKSKTWIASLESGAKSPTLTLLLQLHHALVAADDARPEADLKLWLLKWLEVKVGEEKEKEVVNKESALLAVKTLCATSAPPTKSSTHANTIPTLEAFPEGFENLVVICGDRRETSPESEGDLFVDPFSSADLASMKTLFDRTGTLDIRSDKAFVLDDKDYLKREYGDKNIIVVGSTAVNLLTRAVNKRCVFRFSISKTANDFLAYLNEEIPEIHNDHLRQIFWEMAKKWREPSKVIDTDSYYKDYKKRGFKIQRAQIEELARKVKELLKDHTARQMKSYFRKPGFIDPVAARLEGFFARPHNDFGVISLCPNPYADDERHFCIVAAGNRALGTDMAVRVLATNDFKEHPLGGVIEVKEDRSLSWIERLYNANFEWHTKDYTIDDLREILREPEAHSIFEKCDPKDIDNLITFIQRFT